MRVLFRVDASVGIGTGHVMRCLTLASALREQSIESVFLCREHPGHLVDWVRNSGFPVDVLPVLRRSGDTEWLGDGVALDAIATARALEHWQCGGVVVDHYGVNRSWLERLPGQAWRLVLDDLPARELPCELLLNQNLGFDAREYHSLVGAQTRLMIGSEYALLRPEFAAVRPESLKRDRSRPKRLLVNLGGADEHNLSGRVLEALAGTSRWDLTVILGPSNPWRTDIQAKLERLELQAVVHQSVSDMAGQLIRSDLVIGAAGSSAWERCCLGVPALVLVLADNQARVATALSEAGAGYVLPKHFRPEELKAALMAYLETPQLGNIQSHRAAELVDGLGAQRVARQILAL